MLHFAHMKPVTFLAIGDPVIDEFIRLKDASVHCDIDTSACTISMRWGDKIPFESAVLVAGVGNAANAAVAAQRLSIPSALLGITGEDRYGEEIEAVYTKEGLDTSYLSKQKGVPTNHHYVLSFESERTILVKHEEYTYVFPKELPEPKTLYLSSLAETVGDAYYDDMATYLETHPDIFFAFQPGTFQIKAGVQKLSRIYRRADIFFCNKEEAGRILNVKSTNMSVLLSGIQALGPKRVIITDGTQGAYTRTDSGVLHVPMYPDIAPPLERTGAGDAFSSTVTAALTLGLPIEEALLWGPINSMSVVQKIGAQEGLLSREALETYLKEAPSSYKASKV